MVALGGVAPVDRTANHIARGVRGQTEDARTLIGSRWPLSGSGASGVTVTYRPEAKSLTNRLPPSEVGLDVSQR